MMASKFPKLETISGIYSIYGAWFPITFQNSCECASLNRQTQHHLGRMSSLREGNNSTTGSNSRSRRTYDSHGYSRSRNINDSFRLNRRHFKTVSNDQCCCSNLFNNWNHDYTIRKYQFTITTVQSIHSLRLILRKRHLARFGTSSKRNCLFYAQ